MSKRKPLVKGSIAAKRYMAKLRKLAIAKRKRKDPLSRLTLKDAIDSASRKRRIVESLAAPLLTPSQVKVTVWEERDRLHIAIVDRATEQKTIAQWWDDDARQMFEDGFFKTTGPRMRGLEDSVIKYAQDMGLLAKSNPLVMTVMGNPYQLKAGDKQVIERIVARLDVGATDADAADAVSTKMTRKTPAHVISAARAYAIKAHRENQKFAGGVARGINPGVSRNPRYGQRQDFQAYLERKRREYGSKFDPSKLASQFVPYYESGERVEVQFSHGEVKRGRVGVTTGWQPVFLLMLTTRSLGSSETLGPDDRVIRTISQNPGVCQNPGHRHAQRNPLDYQAVLTAAQKVGYSMQDAARVASVFKRTGELPRMIEAQLRYFKNPSRRSAEIVASVHNGHPVQAFHAHGMTPAGKREWIRRQRADGKMAGSAVLRNPRKSGYLMTGDDPGRGPWAVNYKTSKELLDAIRSHVIDEVNEYLANTEGEEGNWDRENAIDFKNILEGKEPFNFGALEDALRSWKSTDSSCEIENIFDNFRANPHFVGLPRGGGRREVFHSKQTPTQESHGHRYGAVIGPFRHKGAARIMSVPHAPVETVAQAEAMFKGYKDRVRGQKNSAHRLRTEYKTVDTTTLEGLRLAERMHKAGWKTGQVTPFRVQFYRKPSPEAVARERARRGMKPNPSAKGTRRKVTMTLEAFAKMVKAKNDPKLWSAFLKKVEAYKKWSHGTLPKKVTVEQIDVPGMSGMWMTYDAGKAPETAYVMPRGTKRKGAWVHQWDTMPDLKNDPDSGIVLTKLKGKSRITDFYHR